MKVKISESMVADILESCIEDVKFYDMVMCTAVDCRNVDIRCEDCYYNDERWECIKELNEVLIKED